MTSFEEGYIMAMQLLDEIQSSDGMTIEQYERYLKILEEDRIPLPSRELDIEEPTKTSSNTTEPDGHP